MKNTLFYPIAISLLIFACSGEGGGSIFNGSELPANPEKLTIEWSDGGGMLPEGENIFISEDSSYWSMWRLDYEQKIYFTTSSEELNQLYQVFLENDFDQIKLIEEQEVYDRGGTSIRLITDGKYFDKNNSGMTFVHDNSWDNYAAVSDAICSFAKEKTESSKIPVKVKLSNSLLKSNYLIYINVNDHTIYNSDRDSALTEKDTVVYAAPNGFDVMLYRKDSTDSYGNEAFLKSFQFVKTFSAEDHVVEFGITKEGDLTGK
ncbi:MAG: hypothetical protein IPO32_15260 [Crocinitomicaceae bacterium]|nr:hypothetical protein [Crocinitomicaceae bacterium]